MREHHKKSTWKPHHVWWAEKKEAERLRKERCEWEAARDETIQNLMQFKERAEDFCSVRIAEINGTDVLQLRDGDNPFEAYTCIADYEHTIARLQLHISDLDYDIRIAAELPIAYS